MRDVIWVMPSLAKSRMEPTRDVTAQDMFDTAGYPFKLFVIGNNDPSPPGEYRHDLYTKIVPRGNIGICKALNLVWRKYAGAGVYLGFCADNFTSSRGWLKTYMDLFDAEPGIGLISSFLPGINRGHDRLDRCDINVSGGVRWVNTTGLPSKAILASPDLVERIGFWNEELKVYGRVDADYEQRAALAGFMVAYIVGDVLMERIGEDKKGYLSWKITVNKMSAQIFEHHLEGYKSGKRSLYIP